MLRRLSLRNFVLIHELSLDFQQGFSAITGETGSGKSILLQALGLIRGDRADFSTIGPYDTKSFVEAVFDCNDDLKQWLQQKSYDVWDSLIIRREIAKDGRSRSFINDTPGSLSDLKLLSEKLFIIHSQYHTLELKNRDYQRYVLDALAGTEEAFQAYAQQYAVFIKRKADYVKKQEELISIESKWDYEQFILSEIKPLMLNEVNYEDLSNQLIQQESRQKITDDLHQLVALAEGAVSNELSMLSARFQRLTSTTSEMDEIIKLLGDVTANVTELGFLSQKKIAEFSSNALDEESILAQVDEYNRLLNKHRLTTQEALLALQELLEGRMNEMEEKAAWILQEEKALRTLETSLVHAASLLNTKREKAIPSITTAIQEGLTLLKLSGSVLSFNLHPTQTLNERGMMELSILFSANPGMEPVPIQKAASGGELSRVMLLLQQLISTKQHLPSILFDEIDTGVSGDVAQRMGKVLRSMGEGRQLFAITHLPQVAAAAEHQFEVKKQESNGQVKTVVERLDEKQRIYEIARLMSGEEVHEGAVINAKKLLGIA